MALDAQLERAPLWQGRIPPIDACQRSVSSLIYNGELTHLFQKYKTHDTVHRAFETETAANRFRMDRVLCHPNRVQALRLQADFHEASGEYLRVNRLIQDLFEANLGAVPGFKIFH